MKWTCTLLAISVLASAAAHAGAQSPELSSRAQNRLAHYQADDDAANQPEPLPSSETFAPPEYMPGVEFNSPTAGTLPGGYGYDVSQPYGVADAYHGPYGYGYASLGHPAYAHHGGGHSVGYAAKLWATYCHEQVPPIWSVLDRFKSHCHGCGCYGCGSCGGCADRGTCECTTGKCAYDKCPGFWHHLRFSGKPSGCSSCSSSAIGAPAEQSRPAPLGQPSVEPEAESY